MKWAIDLRLANGAIDVMYYETRRAARESARWYRTHTEGDRRVVSTRVRRSIV